MTTWKWQSQACTVGFAIGVINWRIGTAHPALSTAGVETFVARSTDRKASTDVHGTGVVSSWSATKRPVSPVSAGMRVFAADAFHDNGSGAGADAYDLPTAFGRCLPGPSRLSIRSSHIAFSAPGVGLTMARDGLAT